MYHVSTQEVSDFKVGIPIMMSMNGHINMKSEYQENQIQ